MTTKALITRRIAAASGRQRAAESAAAGSLQADVEHVLPHATLVRGEAAQLLALQDQGYRVKLLPDTEILQINGHRIDITAKPKVTAGLDVPKALAAAWTHHLVQLAAPPTAEWVAAIEALGIDVVEPVSGYGLFVRAAPAQLPALAALPFVAWVGAFKPAWRMARNLASARGTLRWVGVGVYPEAAGEAVAEAIAKAGGQVLDRTAQAAPYGGAFAVLRCELPAKALKTVAALPDVRWIERQPDDQLFDERSVQIVAENLNAAAAPNTAPVAGYQAHLGVLGLTGAGVTIGIVDSGVDTHNNATLHADLAGRLAFFVDASGGATLEDRNGHGTHVAGIAVGNAASGDADPQGFLLGQGVAPGAQFGSINPIGTGGPFMADDDRVLNVIANGGRVSNNSWGVTGGAGSGYTARSRNYDQRVRDPDPGTAGLEHLAILAAAGNDGPGAMTIGAPWEAKNVITVGNSLNFRPGEANAVDDIRGLATSSSRGPAVDGRLLPNVVAPGTDIISARSTVDLDIATPGAQRPRTAYADTGGAVHTDHTRLSGTSMATPHVAGLCALLIEWWRNRTGGRNPSPALLKALLVSGAEDLVGGPDGNGGVLTNIPNDQQGWGRVSLENMVLQAPASDRGPRLFVDQRHAFTAAGQEFQIRVAPVDPARPLRVTLVWTDAAAATGANPARVNDLDLEVQEMGTGLILRGNVFANGFSDTGGAFDNLNNVECVYRQNPAGVYEVRVIAATVAASAHPDIATPWQDFALVLENAEVPPAAPVSVVPVLDRSGSMVFYGYDGTTRVASKQFIDLLGVDDAYGVVSFGDDGRVEFPAAPPAVLQTIVGAATRDAGKAEVDGIAFNGCTFMGDGVVKAQALLAGATTAEKAIVLFSDGYDNKGCDLGNPAKPSALDAVLGLPADVALYACAMGPASDQALLDQLASTSGGRYYFMPAIDELFEIYNYIRGQVTGDSIVANQSAQASASRVGAFVDGLASEATFTVAWGTPGLKFVADQARKPGQICVRLRAPSGRLLHPADSAVRRTVSAHHVVFELQEPLAGQWWIEVSTAMEQHTRYTAAGFVRSPLRIVALADLPRPGSAWQVELQAFDGRKPLDTLQGTARVDAAQAGIATLLQKYKSQLADIRPPKLPDGDALPKAIHQLSLLRDRMLKAGQGDLFARSVARRKFAAQGGRALLPLPAGDGGSSTNVVVTARGSAGRHRFVRQAMVSVVHR
jgi:subtilisin family serine protease